ncbi:RDD family protein [Pontiella sp.]|uniref:RDD family protein n=1 Tax=Pontiella sp. TaxID=2837462 RepID=UPI003563924E
MHWYYVKDGEKAGPIADRDLPDFVTQGEITPETLVWNETMSDWMPYGKVPDTIAASQALATVDTGPKCSICGKGFGEADLIEFEGAKVCAGCKPDFIQQIKENAALTGVSVMRYAGFWCRFGAVFIDGIVMYVANLPIGIAFSLMMPMMQSGNSRPGAAFWLAFAVMYLFQLAIPALYMILMHGKYGATLGKKAMGIKVVMSDGSPISYGRATGRYFAYILSGLILYVGYIMAAFDDEKRALHDHICNTRVIYK